MDIAALSAGSALSNAQTATGLMVLRKAMDTQQQTGQALTEMMATSSAKLSPAHLGQKIDISV